jgi:hypothetical protein
MRPKVFYLIGLLLPLLLLLALPTLARPQLNPMVITYDLSWNVIGSGGTSFTAAGSYSLGGTIGQSAAGPLSGGSYKLNSGFWQHANFSVYLPIVLK